MKNLLSFVFAVCLLILAVLGCAKSNANLSATDYSTPKSFVSNASASPASVSNAPTKNSNVPKQAAAYTAADARASSPDLSSSSSTATLTPDETGSGSSGPRSSRKRSSGGSGVSSDRIVSPEIDHAGATAKCRDGSLSFSAHRRGTCSHHGGVALWY